MDEQMPSTKCVLEIVKDGDGWELQLVRDGETPWPIARSVLPMEIRHTHEPHPVNPTEQELHTEIERLQRENADLRHDLVRAMVNHSKNISSAPEPPDEPTWPHPYGYIRSLLSEAVERAEADLIAVGHSKDGPDRSAAMKDLENWKEKLQDAWIHGDLEVRRASQPPNELPCGCQPGRTPDWIRKKCGCLPSSLQPPGDSEFAWLIELSGFTRPLYFSPGWGANEWHWICTSPDDAVRFPRKIDAQRVINLFQRLDAEIMKEAGWQAVEHGWIARPDLTKEV